MVQAKREEQLKSTTKGQQLENAVVYIPCHLFAYLFFGSSSGLGVGNLNCKAGVSATNK